MNDDEDRKKEDESLVLEAMVAFFITFADYVKQNDPALWKRAREFAVDLSPLPKGVKIIDAEQ